LYSRMVRRNSESRTTKTRSTVATGRPMARLASQGLKMELWYKWYALKCIFR
jgi:hypothetical protein